jgi:hypothetical protein
MSAADDPGTEVGRRSELWGSASEEGRVYQARGSQFITNLHVYGWDDGPGDSLARAVARGDALEYMQGRVNHLIRGLRTTQAEWQARVTELEERAERARTEGREQALAEVQEQLQAAELRVIKAQQMMREAVQEREHTEALLAQAQEELARRRRAEEQRRLEEERDRNEPDAVAVPEEEPWDPAEPAEENEQYDEFLERVEAELGAVRDGLRLLGEGLQSADGGPAEKDVLAGEWVRKPVETDETAPAGEGATGTGADEPSTGTVHSGGGAAGAGPSGTGRPDRQRAPRPGPPRPLRIGVVCAIVVALQPWVPLLVVTSNRVAYASHQATWQKAAFTVVTILLGAVLLLVTLGTAFFTVALSLERDREGTPAFWGLGLCVAAALAGLITAFWSPLAWPGPAGEWAHGIAALGGLG